MRIRCATSNSQYGDVSPWIAYLCIDVCDFLNCAPFAGAAVYGGYNTAVCALAQFLNHSVLGIDDEGRIEGGK